VVPAEAIEANTFKTVLVDEKDRKSPVSTRHASTRAPYRCYIVLGKFNDIIDKMSVQSLRDFDCIYFKNC